MIARRIAVLSLIALGLWALYFLTTSSDPTTEPEPTGPGNATPTEAARDAVASKEEEATKGAKRTEIEGGQPSEEPAPDPTLGNLLVKVVWSDDTPAADVALTARHYSPGLSGQPHFKISDPQGEVLFTGLPPGKFSVRPLHGGWKSSKEAIVVAGKTVELKLEVPVGVDVQGVVVDGTGVAVAAASIWLTSGHTDWLGGRVVTRSDAKGEFQIRSVQKDASIGAIVTGFAPSDLVDLDEKNTAKSPVEIRLTVKEPGGGIEGTVTDPAGKPVAGAIVCVGKQPGRFRQRGGMYNHVETWTPLVATTDAAGHYALPGVSPGEHPVAVRAAGFALLFDKVTIDPGTTQRKDIRLLAGFTVHGTVKDGPGKLIAGVVVRAFDRALSVSFIQAGQIDYESVFPYRYALADDKGRYRLENLTPGTTHLYAMRGKRHVFGKSKCRAKIVVEGEDGAELEWNPVLTRGNTIVGVVTYRDGVPMYGNFVSARNDKTGVRQVVVTDKKGRFEFLNMELADYSMGVQVFKKPKGAKPLEKSGVWPNRGDVRFVAAYDSPKKKKRGKVRGRIHDAAGRVRTGALSVLLASDKSFWNTREDLKDGVFEFNRAEPGKRRIVVKSGETVIYTGPWFELTAAEDRDLGTLVTEPGGSVQIQIHRGKGTEKITPDIYLTAADSFHGTTVRPGVVDGHRVDNLCVGKYRVRAYGKGMMSIRTEVTVEVGAGAKLDLHLQVAAVCPFEVALPKDKKLGEVAFKILDAKGQVCWSVTERNTGAIKNPYSRKAHLAPGHYVLSVQSTTGLKGEFRFEVENTAPDQPVIRLTVK